MIKSKYFMLCVLAFLLASPAYTKEMNAQRIGITASGLTLYGIPAPSKQKLYCHYFVDQNQARKAYDAGHTYLDGDNDGDICESIRYRSYDLQEEIEHYYLMYLD